MRFFPSSRDKLGTSPDNVGRKKARPGRFWSSTPATCTGKGNLFFNVRVCTVPCTKVQGIDETTKDPQGHVFKLLVFTFGLPYRQAA